MEAKYLGEGTYGCVFNADLCISESNKSKKLNKKYVSKVTLKDYDDTERKIGSSIINEIIQYESHFAPIIETCPINIGEINEVELGKCHVVKKAKKKNDHPNFVSNKMKYAGNKSTYDYLDTKTNVCKYIFETHLHLTKGLDKLLKLKDPIIHYDLKDGNIMYDDAYNIPIIIDFGLSYRKTKLFSCFEKPLQFSEIFYNDESYSPWAVEIHLLSFISINIIRKGIDIETELLMNHLKNLNIVVDKFIKSQKTLFENDEEKTKFRKLMFKYLTSFASKPIKYIMKNLINSWDSWDNYAVAVMFYNYLGYNETKIDKKNNYFIKYKYLLKEIIQVTPSFERLRPVETSKLIISLSK